MKNHYNRQMELENKKMMIAKNARVLLNDDTQKWMDKQDHKFVRS